MAAREGLSLTMKRGFNDFIFECDSLQIVKALLESFVNMSNLGHIIKDSKASLSTITGALVAYISRQGNGTTHRLACFALCMDETSGSWFKEPPTSL